jgi:glutamate racemase
MTRTPFPNLPWIRLLALILLLWSATTGLAQATETRDWLPGLLEKEDITIVITDSGLGGLSVVADAAEKFRQNPVFKSVNLVFASALFTNAGGYNALQTREEKLAVFSSALQSMQDRFDPDIILVACNTLSVLIEDTEFAKTTSVPLVGIVNAGVDQIARQLQGKPGAKNILFATQGTVDEAAHKQLLLELGFADDQVVPQACPQLTQYIEQGYDSMYTEMLIDAYVDEALSGIGEIDGPLSISFNCTHFGYAMDSWKQAFASRGVEIDAVLNPNTQMIDFLVPLALAQRYPGSDIAIRVVSMIDIPPDRRDSIGRYLQTVSPATSKALDGFELDDNLFEWRNLVSGHAD